MELIVLLDEDAREIGTAPKLESHHAHTPRHRAFSCYIFDRDGRLLVTQRALSKKVWPGVWTNSVCGHPGPGESFEDALIRRTRHELGMTVTGIDVVLPDYRYTTPPFQGIIENEICPVYRAVATSDPRPNPAEVEAYRWMTWSEYTAALHDDAVSYSYWAKDHYPRLSALQFP